MDSFFFHPKIVHVPIALALIAPLFTGAIALGWWRGFFQKKVWAIAVALQAILVMSAVAAQFSGETDADRVGQVIGHDLVHDHEEAAESFLWASIAVLLVMLAPVVMSRKKTKHIATAVATVGTIVVLAMGVSTGNKGGALVYEHGAGEAYTDPPQAEEPPTDDSEAGEQ